MEKGLGIPDGQFVTVLNVRPSQDESLLVTVGWSKENRYLAKTVRIFPIAPPNVGSELVATAGGNKLMTLDRSHVVTEYEYKEQ